MIYRTTKNVNVLQSLYSPLMVACIKQKYECVKVLIGLRSDPFLKHAEVS